MSSMVKIAFELDADDWHGVPVETLWGEPIIESGREAFLISNSPFYVRGISFLDTVRATSSGYNGFYHFAEVLQRGGHSTVMILAKPDDARFSSHWSRLERIGCSYESSTEKLSIGVRKLYSVDVPPSASLAEVLQLLERGEADGVWMYQHGHLYTSA
jgi:uncharacterized protein DUF4265